MIWALIPAIAGMASQAAGGAQAAAATVEGAQTQADIEAMNREFQEELFNKELERNRPRYEAGLEKGLPQFKNILKTGRVDLEKMPAYRAQRKMGENALSRFGADSPFARNRLSERLGVAENEATKARLNDLLQLSLGASGSAGQGAANFANAASTGYANIGNVLAGGNQQAAQQRQSTYGNLAGQIGSIPAYISQRNYLNQGSGNPYITTQNPLGLTPGQGL